jgi:crotonobetainyl-CoA:carnitine CoA-transferase CaiB-like acyl-CoA transferase
LTIVSEENQMPDAFLPLKGIRVVEFTHMVMGPTCGMILGDLGADVIKVEPLAGDNTRKLIGSGAGFFACFNRNKRSLTVDIQKDAGRAVVRRLLATADVFSENFKAGALAKYGFDFATLTQDFPSLIYVSHKGFLPGPYEHRTALDEVVQMMGGLAYMTGPEGRPLRAGSSVNDIMGGMFGAIGVLAALSERARTKRGVEVQSALFENNILLVAQHMLQFVVTGHAAAPMPSRISAWGVYDVFTVAAGEQIFLAVVSDTQWATFCTAFGFSDWLQDSRLATNNDRIRARDWMLPELRARLATHTAQALASIFEAKGLPYAPIARPQDLFADPHLTATGGMAPMHIPADASMAKRPLDTHMPLLPLAFAGERLPLRRDPPGLGAHTLELLKELGYSDTESAQLCADAVVRAHAE